MTTQRDHGGRYYNDVEYWTEIAENIAAEHAAKQRCELFSMARILYTHDKPMFYLYMETYIRLFHSDRNAQIESAIISYGDY